jgi:hypothetical protein
MFLSEVIGVVESDIYEVQIEIGRSGKGIGVRNIFISKIVHVSIVTNYPTKDS